MARCGVRCEYEQVSLLVVTVERIRAVGAPFRDGGQRQYMVPPEKTHETFVYCFAAAARFCRPGFRASGRFRNRGVPFRSRDASFRNGSVLFRRRSVPLCSRGAPSAAAACPPFVAGELLSAAGTLPFSAGASSVFVSGTLCSVPGFSVSRLSAAFVAIAGCTFFPSVSAAAICVISLPWFRLPGRKPPELCGITSESSCVMRSSSFTSPFSSAAMRSRTNSNVARFSFCDRLGGFLRNFQRVDRRAVFPDAVVEMRSRRSARRSDIADQLPLRYARTLRNAFGVAAQVQVTRHQVARMLDLERVPPPPPPAFEGTTPSATACTGVPFGAGNRRPYAGGIPCRSDVCGRR